jgi:hypothetical protein
MIDLFRKIYAKYSFLVILAFSLLNAILVMVIFENNSNVICQHLLITFYFLCIIGLSVYLFYIKYFDIKNIVTFVFIILGLLITIDLYFTKSEILPILLAGVLIIIYTIYFFTIEQIFPDIINYEIIIIYIVVFIYILINNAKITKLFKDLVFENSKKYILLILYYIQSNLFLINLFTYINLHLSFND